MNITENPRMKKIELLTTVLMREEFSLSACSCSSEIPEMIEMYPGTSGSTQGERKDTTPAANAAKTDTLSIMQIIP